MLIHTMLIHTMLIHTMLIHICESAHTNEDTLKAKVDMHTRAPLHSFRWCHFLDSLTEEMEEAPTVGLYDDYKFVTKEVCTASF